ncbi:MAG: TetR/AcrR family transcriptional regulator C-terminal domain-containing protein [Cellulosilyticaceae bacterium]
MKENVVRTYQTKKDIMDAFWSLYCERRIEKITVKEVIHKAGYNRSTFYQYFKDIYDVLEQIENEIIPTKDELPALSLANMEIGMPVELVMNLYDKNREYYCVLLGDKGDPAFSSKLKNAIKDALKGALSSKVEINLIELEYILEFVLSAMIGIMSYWFKQDAKISTQELATLIKELMENGIIPKMNKEMINK